MKKIILTMAVIMLLATSVAGVKTAELTYGDINVLVQVRTKLLMEPDATAADMAPLFGILGKCPQVLGLTPVDGLVILAEERARIVDQIERILTGGN